MFQVKQNETTAIRRRIPVLLVDATDGYTPETGITGATITISKNGTIVSAGVAGRSLTEVGNGIYYYGLGDGNSNTANEIDTLGWVSVNVSATGCRNYNAIVQIMAYDAMDSTGLGLSRIDTNIGSRMVTFSLPSNFDLLSINGSGEVVASSVIGNVAGSVNSVVTGVTLANNSVNANSVSDVAAQEIANAVWTANIAQTYSIGGVPAANWANNTFGDRVVISDSNNQNEVAITGSNHIAADIHEIQPDEIIDIAQGVLTEATSTNPATYAVGDVGNILGRLVNMVEADGADFRYTTNALEQAPSGGGGGGSTTNIHMGPFVVKADGEESDIPLDIQKNAAHDIDIQLTDVHGTGVSLAGATTSVKVYNTGGTLVATYSGTATYSADGRLTFAITTAVTANAGTYTATVTRTTGASDTQVFGPLRIYVRDI